MEIEAFKYVLELLTPTIVTSSFGYRGMSYSVTTDYIPGSMVRGALLTQLIVEKVLTPSAIAIEARAPKHSVTPALYVPKEMASSALPYRDVAFAHSLSFSFKGDREVLSLGIDRLLKRIEGSANVEKALSEVLLETIFSVDSKAFAEAREDPLKVLRCSTEMRSACGMTIVRRGSEWVIAKPTKGIHVENAVDRARGSAALGALYAYEYINPGNAFVGYIAIEKSSVLSDAIKSVEGSCIIVRVGRGTGRGFGIARLCIESVELSEAVDHVRVDTSKPLVLYAASPLSMLNPLPKPLAPGDLVDLEVLGVKVARVRVETVIGRSITRYYGWSYRSGTPKLPIKALAPGTLAIVKFERVSDANALSMLSLTGFSSLSSQGFNFAKVLDKDFIEVVG